MIVTRTKDSAHSIAQLADGRTVYADLGLLPLSQSISRNPHLLQLIEEAISNVTLRSATAFVEHDMGRPVGYSEIVKTTDKDQVFYARQTKSAGYTRFVKNHQTRPTRYVTTYLERDAEGDFKVCDVWLGKAFPAVPGTPNETDDSQAYWADHAVVFNGQSLIASTLTKDCPY